LLSVKSNLYRYSKGPDALLRAYWDVFSKDDAVVLRIRSSVPGWAGLPFQDAAGGVAHYARQLHNKEPRELAAVETIGSGETSRVEMAALFRDADAFVLPSRGEGWCLPCAEAMASDTLLIASDFSGMTAFANTRNSLPVRCPVLAGGEGHCEPDVEGLAWRMRWAHEHPDKAAELGRRGGEDMRQNFGVRVVAEAWRREAARAHKHFDSGLGL
jgi:glycosyltransferase involved in cell wall biosynthesis